MKFKKNWNLKNSKLKINIAVSFLKLLYHSPRWHKLFKEEFKLVLMILATAIFI
jgi:hypothetical protein